MKDLAPQPRPRYRVSWTVVRLFCFLWFVVAVFSAAAFGAGWLVNRWGGPPWLMVVAGVSIGMGLKLSIDWLVRRRR